MLIVKSKNRKIKNKKIIKVAFNLLKKVLIRKINTKMSSRYNAA
jgi:hypothetical protein